MTDQDGRVGFSASVTLTAADKALVKNATGWDIDADPLGNTASDAATALAGRMTLDRFSAQYYGDSNGLVGTATAAYFQGLINQQVASGTDAIPLSTLDKALSYLSGNST